MQMVPYQCMRCMYQMYCPFYHYNLTPFGSMHYESAFNQHGDNDTQDIYTDNPSDFSNSRIADFSGTWSSTYGILEMTQDGNNVRGVYPTVKTSSYFKNWTGRLDGTVSGDTMIGNWSESRYPGHFAQGKFRFRLLPDGDHFLGTRGTGDKFEGGPWDGHRV